MLSILYRLQSTVRRALARAWELIAATGAAMTWPIERAFAATLGRAFRMLEGFDRVEDWLLGLVRLIAWPVRMAWRLVVAMLLFLVPAVLRQAFGDRLIHTQDRLGAGVLEFAERFNLDGPVRRLVWLLQPLWRPFAALGGFLYAWLATRPYRHMLWGIPVLVLLLPLAAAVSWGVTGGRGGVVAHYRLAAAKARDAEDFPALQLFDRKLAQLGVSTQASDYKQAELLAQAGKLDEAYQRMQLLAPEHTVGFPAAHHWMLVRLLNNELDIAEQDRLRLARVHLDHLQTLGFRGDESNLLQAICLAQTGQLAEAADLLKPLVSSMPMAALQRFEMNVRLERLDDAKSDARAVCAHCEEAQRRTPQLASEQYRAWAQCLQLLGDSANWAIVVRQWLAVDPNHKLARQCVAALDLQEFNDMLQATHVNPQELAKRLAEMAQLADNPQVFDRQVAQLYRKQRDQPALAAMFEQLIATNDAPLPLLSAIGTAAALEGDVLQARALLSRVVAADPKNPVAWNNYAWTLAQDPDKDVALALNAVNNALELTPAEPRFRETRGQILVTLGRWQAAVDDLEFALNGMPDASAIHIALAIAYDQLGEHELAAIHRQQAL